jgi:hypothetical protein
MMVVLAVQVMVVQLIMPVVVELKNVVPQLEVFLVV